LFLAAAFMCSTILGFADAGLTSLNVLAYLVITFELSLSPIGLSIMTKLSPKDYLG
jgi:dipeptide/tripeptide permease